MEVSKSDNAKNDLDLHFLGRAGFTLIEVIVAVAILSVTLVMIMQLFAAGLKSSRASCDYTRAVMHAKDKMEELFAAPVQKRENGEFRDGYKWETVTEPYNEPTHEELKNIDINLLKMKVKIMWSTVSKKENSVEFECLRMLSAEDGLKF